MTDSFDFKLLVDLCRRTHEQMQERVAQAASTSLAARNWLFGWYIVEYEQRGADRAAYGTQLIPKLSARLAQSGIRGVSKTRLKLYRLFYTQYREMGPTPSDKSRISFPESMLEIGPTLSDQSVSEPPDAQSLQISQTLSAELAGQLRLGWSHYVELLTIDSTNERNFYEIEAVQNQWSVRELKRQIESSLYERLALSRDKGEIRRLAREGQVVEKAADLIKNPLVLEFLGLDEKPRYSEHELETAIIDKIESFLLELGKGFLFEARQKRFTFDDDHFYVDLVFYNRLLRCYVLVDLKRDKLTHQDLGQMQMYVNYFDRHVKLDDELPTIGIVLCHRGNDAVVELTLPKDANIFASKYQLYLPSKAELKEQLQLAQASLEDRSKARNEGVE